MAGTFSIHQLGMNVPLGDMPLALMGDREELDKSIDRGTIAHRLFDIFDSNLTFQIHSTISEEFSTASRVAESLPTC
jgi:hypothetical protein